MGGGGGLRLLVIIISPYTVCVEVKSGANEILESQLSCILPKVCVYITQQAKKKAVHKSYEISLDLLKYPAVSQVF